MPLITLMRSLLARFRGHTAQASELAPPRIEALLPDVEGGEINLLRYSATEQALNVGFAMWEHSNPSPTEPETLTLFWDDDEADQKTWTAPVPEDDLFLLVPQALLLMEGQHTLEYEVELYNGNRSRSAPITVTIDRKPPELPTNNTLIFDPEVIRDGVTDAYLVEHGEELEAIVPIYVGISPGDVLTWYWTTTPSGTDQADNWHLALKDISQPLIIRFPGRHIRDMGDGTRYAHYTVQDRAGTPIQRSQAIDLDAKPTPLPINFSAPYLKETGSTGDSSTLNPATALNGATIVIKADNRFEPTDTVTVFWGNPGDHGAYHTTVEVVAGAIECPIPKANVAARMGSQLVLYFVVTRRGVDHTSRPHALTVQAPRNLPHPQCVAIQAGKLSLSAMGTQATFTLPTGWSLRDTGQFVRLYITGLRNDGGKQPVVVADATPVPSPTGAMTVGTVTPAALGVFVMYTGLEVEAFLSVDGKSSWIPFPHVPVQLID